LRLHAVVNIAIFLTFSAIGFCQTDAREFLDAADRAILQGRPDVTVSGTIKLKTSSGITTPKGLTDQKIADAIELILRRNGVPVVDACNRGANCGGLVAIVRASCIDVSPVVCSFGIELSYREWARPERPTSGRLISMAVLWGGDLTATGGLTTGDSLEKDVIEGLTSQAESFALAYLRANPVKPK
jgi:hypothetical protein